MFNPVSTYRVQLHKGFTFSDLEAIIPYLHRLGVKTIYASPVFKAVPGSTHGYDVTDPLAINPEIGTLQQLYKLSAILKALGMSWLQDIVPNHMALHEDNVWLADVLKNGPDSPYITYFDIDLEHPVFSGKIMMPVLDTDLEDALNKGSIQLAHTGSGPVLQCNGIKLPLSNASLALLSAGMPADKANSDKKLLSAILQKQYYTLCGHQETCRQINYRRFFTINGLISLNMQRPEVFHDYHSLIKKLCDDGVFQGLRVDHIDGLFDPEEYLYRLKKLAGKDVYITVEKILQPDETLPADWPVTGSTGYDFLGLVNNLFTAPGARKAFTRLYRKMGGAQGDVSQMASQKKLLILHEYMAGDLGNLCRIAESLLDEYDAPVNHTTLRNAISMFLAECPVYRYYGGLPLSTYEAGEVGLILSKLERSGHAEGAKLLRHILIERPAQPNPAYLKRATFFYRRCMQVAGPLMAKGVEDTLMYSWNCFIGHNEVGDQPDSWGCTAARFHAFMQQRQLKWPMALNATATHDTKRGEDARARLNMLTCDPDEWERHITHWHDLFGKENVTIAPKDEYLIYHALLAAWPQDHTGYDGLKERFSDYLVKALREGKERSNWQKPEEQYEQKVIAFAMQLLDSGKFRSLMDELHASLTAGSVTISLCQLLLKMTCPGIPDIYQGNELWDHSMVDPDNRRPVDYEVRKNYLEHLPEDHSGEWWSRLWHSSADGRIKAAITNILLKERAQASQVFCEGEYVPLTVKGRYKKNILAFARRHAQVVYMVIIPLHRYGTGSEDWHDTSVELPEAHGGTWLNVLTNEKQELGKDCKVKHIFGPLPLAFLKCIHRPNERRSGLLMPVFSLPADYGMGDLGVSAYSFIDFLAAAHHKLWQLLPLNPTVSGEAHSPYSSISAMAMNTLFIAPDVLAKYGLLKTDELYEWHLPHTDKIDYEKCRTVKEAMFQTSWKRFSSGNFKAMESEFDAFCQEHDAWLADFALYVCIKHDQNYAPWYKWPVEYRSRNRETLDEFAANHNEEITRVKWLQYLACKQWGEVRQYARIKGVELFGDMPFYVSYDSVDVWVHPELFCLDNEGNMTGIAGVPPDLFSSTGQLWNMPTFNWHELEKTGYKWWIDRIRRNLEIFDLLRIDHFRAFESYWQVAAGQPTAEHGRWLKGPGMHFFDIARKEMGHLPLIAEDLGEEMEDVYVLRNKTGLPGMKVLQFAWGANMPAAVDVPHNHTENCVAYTGTHDNNTVCGWWADEAAKDDKKRMREYTGQKVGSSNVHMVMMRLAYASVANIAVVPVQDVLGLGSAARINSPGSAEGNWIFRLPPGALTRHVEKWLRRLAHLYNRY